jgi:hypothetical protein
MTNQTKKISTQISTTAIISLAILVMSTLSVSALATVDTNISTDVTATNVSASVHTNANTNISLRLSDIITKANTDIAKRVEALNALNTRVQGMKNESSDEKASISSQVQTNITGLTTLKAKIDADTDASLAKDDIKGIFSNFRIYALVIPQGWIAASADRVATISGLMTSLSAKIQARIAADQSVGKSVTSLTAVLAEMNAKVLDASSQSVSANASVTALVPDQGNASIAATNKSTLVAAHAKIKIATDDLKAARKDVATLLAGLKSLGSVSVSASSSANITTH